ncbi:response regulator transcription factor [Marinilabilia salmonicolor]|jgi:DNA-binding NarL/FixJ family response regulator|uniref:LuxR family two component transcriptional regulator n=1 Tax=Marinilabilia salmonicolor TaxID=989 RepID=A0A368UKH1_9BACT|nr:response regulator transcription factor [Marinilabilia salmonicolor]RCW26101.1 LuxR family two component transcriptional regulator [Marinilabilia salmonicolor]
MRISIVDDHQLFRDGLKFLLSGWDFIDDVFVSENGDEFLKNIESMLPDVVLMDIEMPGTNGIDTTIACLEKYPDLKIIALSMYGNENYYTGMIDAGAKGFLLKNSRFENVQRAITEVINGNNYFSPEILNGIVRNLSKKKTSPDNSELTSREIEVLYNICKGLSNQEIANNLNLSKRTVDKHRENILLKTQSGNTAQMVVYAIKNKLFEI